MGTSGAKRDVASGRLPARQYEENFADLHPPLGRHPAMVEADRCYFCHDAPCVEACPTDIDIPMFIRQISTGNPMGAAETILKQNIMGGMCARVCPTETLCEEVCVRETAEGKPVKIGMLQRHATDVLFADGKQIFTRAPASGKRVAVVGAGPAGLSCAHRLAVLGHSVTVFDAREKPGGLNEYGIAAYKSLEDFAQHEAAYILSLGGIEVVTGKRLGSDLSLERLRGDYDAVFLGVGLGTVRDLGLEGEDLEGVIDAVDYISDLRQAGDLSSLPVGREVVVIGGGMTAIDIAVQSKLLGAEEVTLVYRRGQEQMNASGFEQDLAQTSGVKITHFAQPARLIGEDGAVRGIEFERTRLGGHGRLEGTGETFTLAADVVFKAIGQIFVPGGMANGGDGVRLEDGRIAVDGEGRTSLGDVWAGGDCVAGGQDLTVAAVQDGKAAAISMDRALRAQSPTRSRDTGG